jgi:hypothetical protein
MRPLLGADVLRVRSARELRLRAFVLTACVPQHHVRRAVRADPDAADDGDQVVSYYRDNATAIAQRAAGNFIGVVLYAPVGGSTTPWWSASTLTSATALEDWYEEIAGAPPLYFYIAAFDKARGTEPVGEATAPIKPGMPGFNMDVTDKWRHPPYKSTRETISGMPGLVSHGVVLQNPGSPREQQVWAYEVRWLRGLPLPSLPSTIKGHPVKLVIVDDYPRPQATISGSDRGSGGIVKTIALFAVFAIPVGILLSRAQEKKHLRNEKDTFQRLGVDWNKRDVA